MEDKKSELIKKMKKIDKTCIFSKEKINISHQPEFDYLKTLGVFSICVSHVYMTFSEGCLRLFVDFLRFILTPGALMLLMGIGMKYTRHHEPKNYIYRGFVLVTMSQLVNFLRDCLPNLIAWWTTGNKNFLAEALLILQVDILSFAGIAFIFLGLLKLLKLSDICIMIIGIMMNIIHFYSYKLIKSPNNYLLSQFFGYFIITDAETYFPLCSYFIFVSIGYWLGEIYQKISNKDKFYNRILFFCLPPSIIYRHFRDLNKIPKLPEFGSIEYYFLNPGPDAIICVITNLSVLAIFYKIDTILKGTPEFIAHAGKNMNQYYIISYILTMQINCFIRVTKGNKFPSEMKYPSLLGLMALFISRILIDINDKYIHFTIITLKNPLRNYVFTFIWILTIICVIYIYPKLEAYANVWNNYLNRIEMKN